METKNTHASDEALREPFWRLLYLYFWPFAYFRDVTRGRRMERQQNYRHNRAMRSLEFISDMVMRAMIM